MFELVIAVSLTVIGGGIVWVHHMSKKVEAEKKTQGYTFDDGFGGLPEPKVYTPMPKVNNGQVPPKAPPPAPSGYVPKPKEWPAPPPPKKVETNLYSNNVSAAPSRPVQPTQPVDGFSTSMMMGAATGSAALGYVVGGNLVGAMLGSAMNSDDDPSRKEEAYEPTPSRHIDEPTPVTSSWSSSTDDDSSSKSSYSSYSSDSSSSYSSYDSGSSWSSSDSSSSSWSSD